MMEKLHLDKKSAKDSLHAARMGFSERALAATSSGRYHARLVHRTLHSQSHLHSGRFAANSTSDARPRKTSWSVRASRIHAYARSQGCPVC